MAAVTFGDAAAYLGHKSRSTLYRLKRDGFLAGYLRAGGKGGALLLELEPEGLPNLREHAKGILRARVDAPLWAEPERGWQQPPAGPGSLPFWNEWGRVARPSDPQLTEEEAEENAALMVASLLGPSGPRDLPRRGARFWLWEVEHAAAEARRDVAAGARFDQARWDEANAHCLLGDLPCAIAGAQLRELLEAGRIPADLVEEVREALAST